MDEVALYLPPSYARFPDWDGTHPSVPEGVTIRKVARDYGPATKLLGALTDHQDADCQILFCDDDMVHDPKFAGHLFEAQMRRPADCVAGYGVPLARMIPDAPQPTRAPRYGLGLRPKSADYRRRRIVWKLGRLIGKGDLAKPKRGKTKVSGYADILFGVRGAVVRPGFFDEAVFAVHPPHAWVDDVWISGHLERGGTGIWIPVDAIVPSHTHEAERDALKHAVFGGAERHALNTGAIRYFQETYGIWR